MTSSAISVVPVRPTATSAVTAAAVGAAGICTAFAGMQLALAAGAPLGEHVWGGTQARVLSTEMRFASGGAVIDRKSVV